jgi:hypothetical protein
MGDYIEYKGEDLGNIHFSRDNKLILVMNGTESLETLLKLEPSEILNISGTQKSYEKFREEVLLKTETIYTSPGTYLRNETEFPIGIRVPYDLLKKARLSK